MRRGKIAGAIWALGLIGGLASGHSDPAWQVSLPDPCLLCEDTSSVTCPTCDGAEVFERSCQSCKGKGKLACQSCEKGRKDCPTRTCRDGMISWRGNLWSPVSGVDRDRDRDRDPCRFCSRKGTVKCQECVRGQRRCADCRGRRKVKGPCMDCAGSGRLPCPLCTSKADSPDCLWCESHRVRACSVCTRSGLAPQPCPDCGGDGKLLCSSCQGHGRLPCQRCGATGKMRVRNVGAVTGKGGVRPHDTCSGKGVLRCQTCKGGMLRCPRCKNGRVKICLLCEGSHQAPCSACQDGPYWPAERAAQILRHHGHHDFVVPFLERAQRRAVVYFEEEDQKNSRALERWTAKYEDPERAREEKVKRVLEELLGRTGESRDDDAKARGLKLKQELKSLRERRDRALLRLQEQLDEAQSTVHERSE